MNQSKRLKIAKRDKQTLIDLNYQKELTIQQAFQHQKSKNITLKQKNQKLQIKCRLLYQKLYQQKQNPDQIFTHLNQDIFQLDSNIKQLQQQLYFRYSKQMFKLKKKIKNFFHLINFQIDDDDLQQVSDQIDLILLIMQVFQVKYDELTSENVQTFELIQKLRQPQQISGTAQRIKQLQQQLQYFTRQNNHLKDLVKDYQRQLMYCKKTFEQQKNVQTYKQNGQSIQTNKALQKYKARINQLQGQKNLKDIQIQKRNKKISQLQNQLQNINKKAKSIYDQFEKYKKDQSKWKQRYSLMEDQKNQRIKLLQSQLNRRMGITNTQDSIIGYSAR